MYSAVPFLSISTSSVGSLAHPLVDVGHQLYMAVLGIVLQGMESTCTESACTNLLAVYLIVTINQLAYVLQAGLRTVPLL